MKSEFLNLFLVVLLSFSVSLTKISSSSAPASDNNNSTSPDIKCPMDVNYVLRIPWSTRYCRNYDKTPQDSKISDNTTSVSDSNQCCQTLLSVYGIAFAERLKATNLFQLPNLETSISCLHDFQSKINTFSLSPDLTSLCFDPLQFVISPNVCASIETTQDWVKTLGNSTILDSACRPDLSDLTACDACLAAATQVQSQLLAIDGNKSHSVPCFYFTVLYAAGIVNKFGPQSNAAISCIFNLQLKNKKGHSALIFGLTGASLGVLVVCLILGLYSWWAKKWRGRGDQSFDLGSEEMESRPRTRPNTVSIWFEINEIEKATDNFSSKNFIGRGGFGIVYKGTLADGTVVAVKRVIESDFQGNDEFCNEVEIISNLKHRNLVPLRGCCVTAENQTDGYEESGRYLIYDYMPNGNLDDHLFPANEGGTRKQTLTWPQRKNWAWSMMKSGKIDEVLDSALLKNEDSANANPKGIMERFVLVGILCAHVMVALRPTILDALKMLEGDIEVPPIPDRPAPLMHPSFQGGDGNTFSISPALSALKLKAGDMLR
ncbi:hypothetical protein ACH5RR_001906 [Cinchona calisaya]|uniref:non-specific serine/threonine protein kinase n=1 Tax=Cinchona calisaya TaxID=153742 RepID=A0ABD3B4T9_9GENT